MNDSYREGTVADDPRVKWLCNWKLLVTLSHYSRTVYTARSREQLVCRPRCCLSGLAAASSFFKYDFIDFIHSLIDWFLMDGWIASLYLHCLPPAQRDYGVLPSLIVPHLFGCLCIFEQPTVMSRSQGHKTINCFTMLQIITMTTSTRLKGKNKTEWLQ